jgi:hypothetical protein
LAVGSLLPEESERQQQQQLLQQQRLSWVVMAAAAVEHEEAVRMKEQIIEQFPHGAPVSCHQTNHGLWLFLSSCAPVQALPACHAGMWHVEAFNAFAVTAEADAAE